MKRLLLFALGMTACGQVAAAEPQLQPFTARYEVYVDGKRSGEGVIELRAEGGQRWRHSLSAEGTEGLARFARFRTDQVGEIELHDGRPRVLSARMTARSLIRDRDLDVVFDWQHGQVRWQGDIEDDQPAQRALQGQPATGSTLNLLLAFDAARASGERVLYVLHDRGKANDLDYLIAPAETVQVPLGSFSAVPVRGERRNKQRVTTAWYAAELPPTPVRMLQTEKGEDKYELRLVAIERG